jgi:GNAT superfamily N-acetyltransferase
VEWKKDEFLISDDKSLLDHDLVFDLLSKTYWANDRSKEKIIKSFEKSVCFGLYFRGDQIGFARVVTDGIVFSWICDVIIRENFRGTGLGKWLMDCVTNHPEIKNTRQMLATRDAHGLYKKFGFQVMEVMSKKP